jgi:hypothetical protein
MDEIVRRIKELLEAAEPEMTVVQMDGTEKPFACPVGMALWSEYRRRNPNGFTLPPIDGVGMKDSELLPYLQHTWRCSDCKSV